VKRKGKRERCSLLNQGREEVKWFFIIIDLNLFQVLKKRGRRKPA